jgi:methyl-accepting chemotaxis protein
MKNLKVSHKLISSFLIVAILTAAVGLFGIVGMSRISQGFTDMYDDQTVPMPYMTNIIEMLQRQRACMREYIISAGVGDTNLLNDARDRVDEYRLVMDENMTLYRATIRTTEALNLFDQTKRLYDTSFYECMERIYAGARDGASQTELFATMREYTNDVNKVADDFKRCLDLKIDVAYDASQAGEDLYDTLLVVITIVLVAALAIAIFLALYISGLISKPLVTIATYFKKAGATGDLSLQPENIKLIEELSKRKDELSMLSDGAAAFIQRIMYITEKLDSLASGDLTAKIEPLSNEDSMGHSVQKMVDSLNKMFGEINSAASQVSSGSQQISDGAQSLAQGSTEQTATVQELSASSTEIAEKTKNNAVKAEQAAELATTIKGNAEKGSHQMAEMMSAVGEITQASQSISKVIKVIDDIAFQTNILALNAAVEAARAGQHGKGFAVVAEEVRNLAAKSAEAAKDTGGLIENSIQKAELGARIAGETAASLVEIVSGINESSQLIGEIAASSNEQTVSIAQIHDGIEQVSQVVQQNSATAEESAAASQQLSGQASLLEQLIAQFKLRDGNMINSPYAYKQKQNRPGIQEKTGFALADNSKY